MKTLITILTIVGPGALLLGFVVAARNRRQALRRISTASSDPCKRLGKIDSEMLPDTCTLGGVPLRILLSDAAGPGAVLRDSLMIRPPTHGP
jgi:hypothetical protein